MTEKNTKKTLSPEQLEKMKEGRKRASDARKKAKEEAQEEASKRKTALKKSDKSELLALEIQALAQQQNRIDNLKIQVERKKEVKSRLKSIKETEDDPIIEEEDPIIEDPVEDEEELIVEKTPDIPKKVQIVEPVSVLEKKKSNVDEIHDNNYKDIFEKESTKLREKIDPTVHNYYDQAIKKVDYSLPLDQNIQNMIDYVKDIVEKNTKLAESINNEKKIAEEQKEIVQENVVEKQITSQIQKLMKMRI